MDAISPCAVGGILNDDTIPKIKAKIICGAANNQLFNLDHSAQQLADRGITFIPDFLVNRMGIVCCADEAIGYIVPREKDLNVLKHLGSDWDNSIYNLTLKVLRQADETAKTPQEIAMALADKASRVFNPLHGHRGIVIARSIHAAVKK